jgi:cytochrome c oxidase subunit IV
VSAHIVPKNTYHAIFAGLMVLTLVTVWVSSFDLGSLNTVVALAIAGVKATLVVLFFMHVKYGTRLTKLAIIAALYWFGILLALTLSDYITRPWRTYG